MQDILDETDYIKVWKFNKYKLHPKNVRGTLPHNN